MIIKEINVKKIKSFENIRQTKRDEDIANLMRSIKDNGLLQPIGVKEEKTYYRILWGHRRLDAIIKLGWKTIPSVIFLTKEQSMTEEEFFIVNAVENLQKRPNTLFELGRVCKILRKNMSIGEIASRLAIPKSRVQSALTIVQRLPEKWQKRIRLLGDDVERKGDIPLNTASRVAQLRIPVKQKEKILEFASKTEASIGTVTLVASLLQSGKTLKEAIHISNKYKFIDLKFYVDKEKFEKLLEKSNAGNIDLFIDLINNEQPDLAIKNVRQDA